MKTQISKYPSTQRACAVSTTPFETFKLILASSNLISPKNAILFTLRTGLRPWLRKRDTYRSVPRFGHCGRRCAVVLGEDGCCPVTRSLANLIKRVPGTCTAQISLGVAVDWKLPPTCDACRLPGTTVQTAINCAAACANTRRQQTADRR